MIEKTGNGCASKLFRVSANAGYRILQRFLCPCQLQYGYSKRYCGCGHPHCATQAKTPPLNATQVA